MDLDQGVVIITGSATGVGAASARLLASHGCNVVINYTQSEAEAKDTVAACEAAGAEALLFKADVSEDGQCRAMVAAAMARWGRIDGLINSAGITKFIEAGDLDALNAEDFQRIYAVNLIGPYQMARAAAPHMKAQGAGAIVHISSTAGTFGTGSSIAYATSKAALNNLTLALARLLAPEIRVNAVSPGFIDGRWVRRGLGEDAFQAHKTQSEEMAPLGKISTPEDVAEVAVWFLEAADLITGQILTVDAGINLGGRRRR